MSRTIEQTVFVDAPPDVVWRALSDAEQLARWFPVEARVTPGEGGHIWISWGGGTEGQAPITHWEPNRRFGWAEQRGPIKLAIDFHLETKGGGTVVRLVHSGFGDAADWDDEFHMTSGGWGYFLANLRFYLEQHRDVPRHMISFREPVPMSRPEALAALVGPRGLGGGALATGSAGTPFETRTEEGARLAGTLVSVSRATGQLGLTLTELGGAILFLEMEPHPGGARAGFWLSTYGRSDAEQGAARQQFETLYRRALGLAAAPAGAARVPGGSRGGSREGGA